MSSDSERLCDRFPVSSEVQLRAVIFRGGSLDPIEVQLVDVSSNGIRLEVPVCLQFEEQITVHIFAKEQEFDIELAAFVKWLRPSETDDWFVGCRIAPPFSEEALTHLASLGCVDRRGLPRQEVQLSASIWGEAEKTKKAVTLHNLSEDGFGMLAPQPCVVPQRITLRLEGTEEKTVDVIAQVEWQIKAHEGYLCGCSFANGRSYSRLYELIEQGSDGVELPPPTKEDQPNRESLWIALAVLIVFLSPSLLVLSTEVHPAPALAVEHSRESTTSTSLEQVDEQPTDDRIVAAPVAANRTSDENESVLPDVTPDQPAQVQAVPAAPDAEGIEFASFEYRTWVDSTGQHRAVARLLSVEGGTVRLQKEDGRFASVSLDRLSPGDAQYVRRQLALSQ